MFTYAQAAQCIEQRAVISNNQKPGKTYKMTNASETNNKNSTKRR